MASNPKAAFEHVDEYLNSLPEATKTICTRIRKIILSSSKQLVEVWKWGPGYEFQGLVCGWGAFKNHVKITFYNGNAMKDAQQAFNHCTENEFNRSIKITSLDELDEICLKDYIKESIEINKKGYKRVVQNKHVDTPSDLQSALSKNKIAKAVYEAFPYGHKKEYVQWIVSAKKQETRDKRIEKALALMIEKKGLNNQYRN